MKRPYGPAKPIPLPPSFGSSPPGPVYPGPTFVRPPPGFVGSYPTYKKPGPPAFASKPIYEHGTDIELDYEDKLIDKKQVVLHQPGSHGAVQQHVHHHYHHGDAVNGLIPNNPVVIPSHSLGGGGSSSSSSGSSYGYGNGLGSYGYGNGGTYGATYNDFEDYKKAFKIKTPASNGGPSFSSSVKDYADRYPVYEKPNGKQLGANSQYLTNSGSLEGDYQFNNGAVDNGFASSSSNYYEDCVCVPYDQCAAIDHAGRKDDLYLAIDPRNLDKDIEAEIVEVVITDGNGTMSVVRVPKGVNETEQVERARNDESTKEAAGVEVTKRNRRDVKHITRKDDKKQEVQEVS